MSDVDDIIKGQFSKTDPKSPNTTPDGLYGNSPVQEQDVLEEAEKRIASTKKKKKLEIMAKYSPLILDAPLIERTRMTLEMQEKLREVESEGNYGSITTGSMAAKQRELLEKPFWDSSIKLRWANTRPNIHSLRKSQGYRDVLTKDGQEVRDGDAILMGMPRHQYEETIVKPEQKMKEDQRGAIANQFHQSGEAEKVETFGGIKFDK